MKKIVLLLLLCLPSLTFAQTEWVWQTFKDTRVVNGHSLETNERGEGKFIISHRFGTINSGIYDLFGLDQSTIRIGMDYGITNNLTIGAGRSSFEKTYDGFVKYRFTKQHSGDKNFPVSISGLSTMAIEGTKWEFPERENFFSSRLNFAFQILVARKFSDAFSWQLMPTLVHRNLVPSSDIAHDVFSIGSATRWQVTKQVSIQTELYITPKGQLADGFTNSLSLGVDVETKGHVFQFTLSNSRGMIEKFFITETTGSWEFGDIHLGFNITRDFRFRGRKK